MREEVFTYAGWAMIGGAVFAWAASLVVEREWERWVVPMVVAAVSAIPVVWLGITLLFVLMDNCGGGGHCAFKDLPLCDALLVVIGPPVAGAAIGLIARLTARAILRRKR